MTSEPADQALLHELAAESAASVQGIELATPHYRAAIELRARLGDRAGEAQATAAFGRALINVYRIHRWDHPPDHSR